MVQVELSYQQAREIARNIYADIDAYIEQHYWEFEAFLRSERDSDIEISMEISEGRRSA